MQTSAPQSSTDTSQPLQHQQTDEPWFNDPKKFRSLQAQCNILISGEAARWFFSRYQMPKYTRFCLSFDNKYLDTVREYLRSNGYYVKPHDQDRNIFRKVDNIADVKRFVYCHPRDGAPVHRLVSAATTTADLQFLAWNKAYSVYPCITFVQRECYLLDYEVANMVWQVRRSMAEEGLETMRFYSDKRTSLEDSTF
jgi:hypothetical protein